MALGVSIASERDSDFIYQDGRELLVF
jgi:hypothetical protein